MADEIERIELGNGLHIQYPKQITYNEQVKKFWRSFCRNIIFGLFILVDIILIGFNDYHNKLSEKGKMQFAIFSLVIVTLYKFIIEVRELRNKVNILQSNNAKTEISSVPIGSCFDNRICKQFDDICGI